MNYTNKFSLSPLWVELLIPKESEEKPPGLRRYSVTDLIGPPLIRSLKIDFWDKLSEDISERIWRVDGQILDEKLSMIAESFNLPLLLIKKYLVKYKMERKFDVKNEVFTVVGIPDLIEISRRTITDWKKTNQRKVMREDFDEWWKQVGIYAYLYNSQDGFIREALGCYKIEVLGISIFIKDFKPTGELVTPIVEFQRTLSNTQSVIIGNYIRERLLDHYENPYRECLAEEKWMTSDVFAVIKRGNSRALKLCDSEKEANTYINSKKIKDEKNSSLYFVERRPGIPKKCLKYCPVRHFCQYNPNLNLSHVKKTARKPDWLIETRTEALPSTENLSYTDEFSPVISSSFQNVSHLPAELSEEFLRRVERITSTSPIHRVGRSPRQPEEIGDWGECEEISPPFPEASNRDE